MFNFKKMIQKRFLRGAARAAYSSNDPMLVFLYAHTAWKGDLDTLQSEQTLKDCPSFTYLLRQGPTTYEFFISYIEESKKVKHTPFKIELTIRKWCYRNGTGIISDDLEDFIPLVLHCTKSGCRPVS